MFVRPEPPEPGRVKLNASPSKRILLTAARAYSPDIALAELIDNAIDVWRDETTVRDLHVQIHFEFDGDLATRIRFTDDGGGVRVDRLEALVKTGVENPNERAIGVWGQGLKIACIVLAHNATLRSRFREGPTYRIDWNKEWWSKEEWDLWAEVEKDSTLAPGSFEVVLDDLKAPLRREEVLGPGAGESLVSRLGRIYAPLLSEDASPKVKISVHDADRVVPVSASVFGDSARVANVFAYPPGFPPTVHTKTFGKTRRLIAKAIVGLLPEQSRDLSGVTMYGKGRLFAQALKAGTVGFGTRGAAMIPASHPTTWRLLVLLYFEGPSEDIPWRSPTKEGYAENNPYFKDIRNFISQIAAPYAAFTRVAKRLDILPYSKKWSALGQEDVRREILQYCRDEQLVTPMLDANPHLAQATPISPLVEVDHDKDSPEPPLPCLNSQVSKVIALSLAKRDPSNPSLLWSPKALDNVTGGAIIAKAQETSTGTPPAPQPDLLQTSQIVQQWKETRTVSVRVPLALLERVESAARESLNTWILHAIELRVAQEVDPLFAIPPSAREFRPVVQVIRDKIREAVPGVEAIALFGSVARGSADRASDIDLLVVHPNRLRTQRVLNDLFREFRYPAIHGDRYEVRCEVTSSEGLRSLQQSSDAKTRRMLDEVIWLHGIPDGMGRPK